MGKQLHISKLAEEFDKEIHYHLIYLSFVLNYFQFQSEIIRKLKA